MRNHGASALGRGTGPINPWGSVKRRLRLQSPHELIVPVPLPTAISPWATSTYTAQLVAAIGQGKSSRLQRSGCHPKQPDGEKEVVSRCGRGTAAINPWGDWSRRRRFTEPHGLIAAVPRPINRIYSLRPRI